MTDIFASSKLRIVRAKEHIAELNRRIDIFFKANPYSYVVEPDSNGVNKFHKIKFTEPFPEDDLTTVTADVVDNLRAALDHAWYAIAVASHAIKPTGEAYFPFADNVVKMESVIQRGFKYFHKDILTLLRGFEPYKGGNDLLWSLHRICVTNKHQMLAPVCITPSGVQFTQGRIFSVDRKLSTLHFGPTTSMWDRGKNEIVFFMSSLNTIITCDINVTFYVAFDKVDIVSGQPVGTVLFKLACIVDSIIKAIEAEARRLGFII